MGYQRAPEAALQPRHTDAGTNVRRYTPSIWVAAPQLHAGYSAAFRIGGLLARFALTLYIVRYLGFQAMGRYGFLSGCCAGIVALSGLGLDSWVSREAIKASGPSAALILRDRLILRTIVALFVTGIGAIILFNHVATQELLLSCYIIVLEAVSYEIQQGLTARRRPTASNSLLFMRSASWIPFIIGLGIAEPSTRTMITILSGWAIGLSASFYVSVSLLMNARTRQLIRSEPVPWSKIWRDARSAPITYLSELGAFSQVYSDRFMIALILGVKEAGIYTLYWSMTNSVVPIIQASIFNRISPQLVQLWHENRLGSWRYNTYNAKRHILMVGSCGLTAIVAINIAIQLYRHEVRSDDIILLTLLAIATIARLRADLLHIALYSLENDSDWLAINLVSLFASPILSAALLTLCGLFGGALQMLVTALCLWWMRAKLLRLALRQKSPVPSGLLARQAIAPKCGL